MSEVFDPYYLWLGIPPADQPPDHYRLLGITQFESDADVIRNAAEQRMSYLRTVTGPRAKRAQQLVNEIVAAQRILAEDASREKYNAMITESPLSKRRGVAPPAVSTPAFEPPSIDTLDAGSHRRRGGRGGGGKTKSKTQRPQIKIVAAVVPGVLVLIIGVVLMSGGGGKDKANNTSNPETAGRSSQNRAFKGVSKKSTEPEKKKADRDLEEQLARLGKQRPRPLEPKPDKPEAPKPSKKIAASPDNETIETSPASTMADLNPAQRALLDRAAADYKQVTRQEFYSLLARGRELGKANGATWGGLPHGDTTRNSGTKQRFYFLGWHHPDIGTTAFTPKKKSFEPFNQEMRKAVWKAVRNTPAWKEASKTSRSPQGESLPKDRERGVGFNGARASELSETEKAEALLASRGLDEGFNSEWELAELTAAYEEANSANVSPGIAGRGDDGDGDFETELTRQKRHYFTILKEFYKQTNYSEHPSTDPAAKEAAAYLNSAGQRPHASNREILEFTLENGASVDFQIPSDIPAISLRNKVQREMSSQPTSDADSKVADEIASQLQTQYAALRADAKIQRALKIVDGTLADRPELAEAIKQKATSHSLSRPNDREAAKEKETRGDSNSKAVTSQTTEELYKTALEEMLRPYSLAQRKLLRTAMTKYRKATEIEWNKLLKAGQQLAGQTAAIAFRHHGTNEYGQVGFARFNFLAAHHPDVDTSYLGFSKKSIQPFLLEALESSLQILQNKRAWKNASKQRSKSSERLPKPIYEFNRVLSLGGTNNTRNAFTSNIGQPPVISAEVVARVNSGRNFGSITGQALDNGGTEQGWQLGYNRHVFQWRVGTVGGRFSQAESKTGLQEKKVHHVVGTYNGQSMKLYVDGELQSTKAKRGRINYPSVPFVIGAAQDDDEYMEMNGTIYLVRVYAGALSDAQVKSRYNEVRHKIDGLNEGG